MTSHSKMSDAKHCYMKNCGKRLTLMEKTAYKCSKCLQNYCTLHRLAETHVCPHDFSKDKNIEKFIAANICVGEKIIKL